MISTKQFRLLFALGLSAALFLPSLFAEEKTEDKKKAAPKVSYYKQVRPIFQAKCQGCHQAAKPEGDYVMTSFEKLLKGGESETPAIVAGKLDESYLIDLITPVDGEAEMPKGKDPLSKVELELIKNWITQGAIDDTPESAKVQYDMDNPPVYSQLPVVTSIDFSPDGKLIAVAGYHEVLLHKADGSELVARLVGSSERIESVRFSPDGKRLAVTGGLPARMGEVQVWDVEKRVLTLSHNVTFDTVYGASWSSDGKLIAFGCADKTVRAIEADTGKEVLYQGSHNDRVRDTIFSVKNDHVISVGQDRTAKLTELKSQRFIDNITSITPGALKGGIGAVARHPKDDAILIGGADGAPALYRAFRQTKRVIGDNSNLIREFPTVTGRIFGVAFSPDGKLIAAGSSLDGKGDIKIYSYSYEIKLPEDIAKIAIKRAAARSADEKKTMAEYHKRDVKVVAEAKVENSSIYALAFRPDGKAIAVAGSDGTVRIIDAAKGTLLKEFSSVPVNTMKNSAQLAAKEITVREEELETETLHANDKVVALKVTPARITIDHRFDTVQILVSGKLENGSSVDITRLVTIAGEGDVVAVSPRRMLRAKKNGKTELTFSFAGKTARVPVEATGIDGEFHPDFIRDVNPALARMGCNQGTCHGANKGKGALKLSLRGNDAVFDVRVFTDDLAARNVNFASPENSLMLLKAVAGVPHQGGQRTKPGEPYYETLHQWITDGAKLDTKAPRVAGIEIFPIDPIVQRVGSKQQFRIVATYTDGAKRDVTAESHIKEGSKDVAEADDNGLVTSLRRGESPVLARFEGKYAATTLTVMGERDTFVWTEPPANNYLDTLVAQKLKRIKAIPSDICTDAEFIRRIYLDMTGLPPTSSQVRAFVNDTRESKARRNALIDELVGGNEFVEHWTNKWADLLQVNRKYLGVEGAKPFREWIKKEVAENTSWDKFAYKILSASGSNKDNPAASYYKIHRTPQDTMENTTHLFLAVRFSCNKCHDHPFEKWTQNQYYETAAYFARFGLKKDPKSGNKQIGRTAVEAGKPLFEIVYEKEEGEVTHDRTGAITAPQFPFEVKYDAPEKASRREHIARWITSKDNSYFARSFVNRMWSYLLGAGLIEPIDDLRAGNPPTNPELLNQLTQDFLDSDLNVQYLIKKICKSRTYQLSIETNEWNQDDMLNYSHALARRLPAEVLYDSLHRVTGTISNIPGVPAGTRAAELPDAGVKLPSGFLTQFGRPARESPCECERSSGMQLGPIMSLVSGPTVSDTISNPKNELAKLVASEKDDSKLVNELFMRILNRPATQEEIAASIGLLKEIPTEHEQLTATLKAYEKELAPSIQAHEKKRQAAIAKAKLAVDAYEKVIAPREAKLNQEQKTRTAQLAAALKAYEDSLSEKLNVWANNPNRATEWKVLEPKDLSATSATTLTKQKDNSILAKSSNGLGDYKIVAETDLVGITAIRLEALTDKSLPKNGPGRSPDGNFVLTEFEVQAAPKSDPKQIKKITLENAQADFSQNNYSVATAIDGKLAKASNGWAISNQQGKDHVAAFDTSEVIGFEKGTILTFVMKQQFSSGTHSLGKFRLSVATSRTPTLLQGVPEEIAKVLSTEEAKRNDAQKKTLLDYFRGVDKNLKTQQQAVANSKTPRPIDPKLKAFQDSLATASKPLPIDPKLARIRNDLKLSEGQLKQLRLTGVQDIAWALINSPAFLFNH